ncbi:MAG TPA: hypothetical protein VK837_05555, partial [Longimicrobiales bacterium]|nr:hypothetical protein [Longimicrobiales bacterium]
RAAAPAGPTPGASAATGPAEAGLPPEPAEVPPTVRVPLVLAAQATGGGAARPASLRLAVPAPFRLVGARGPGDVEFPGSVPADGATPDGASSQGTSPDSATAPAGAGGWGEPLTYYDVAVRGAPISADDGVVRLTEPDTLWLEYRERDTDCALDPDSVPRFTRAVQPYPGTLRDVRLSYVLTTAAGARRTGVLRLDLDVAPADAPEESFAAREVPDLRPGGFPLADTLLLPRARYPGTCSDGTRSHPLTVQFLASDVSPARAYLIGAGADPRLRLEDLDGDDVLEAEAWDPDGDGRFEARRTLALPLPRALQSSERREVLERQRAAVAARRAAEEAARRAAAARRARADSAAAQQPDSARSPPPDGPAGGGA